MGGVVQRYLRQRFGDGLPSWVMTILTPPWLWLISGVVSVIPWLLGALFAFFLVALIALFFLSGAQPTYALQPIALPLFAQQWLDVAMSQASMTYHVPMQLLAGDAKQESNFNINATNYSNGSHAQGLFQFEPQTWSGWSNPYVSNTRTDTNAIRIDKYKGYGVDAPEFTGNGVQESASYEPLLSQGESFPADPIGVTTYKNEKGQWASTYLGNESWVQVNFAHFSGANQPPWRLVRTQNGQLFTYPYASPFDPVDALFSAANYFHRLYQSSKGSWSGALEGYYGGPGAHGSSAQNYANAVLQKTWDYLDNTPVLKMPSGLYFPFGWFDFTVAKKGNDEVLRPSFSTLTLQGQYLSKKGYDYFPWVASIPVVMPIAGPVTWQQQHGKTVITLPLRHGKTMNVVAKFASRWMMPEQGKATLPAGAVVGTVSFGVVRLNEVFPVSVTSTFSRWFSLKAMTLRLPNGQIAKNAHGQTLYDPASLGKAVTISA